MCIQGVIVKSQPYVNLTFIDVILSIFSDCLVCVFFCIYTMYPCGCSIGAVVSNVKNRKLSVDAFGIHKPLT